MILIYNRLGMGFVMYGMLAAMICFTLMVRFLGVRPLLFDVCGIALALVTIPADLRYRHMHSEGTASYFHWESGGQLFFLPVWFWGSAAAIAAFYHAITRLVV